MKVFINVPRHPALVDACTSCVEECEACITHALLNEELTVHRNIIQACRDCISVAGLLVKLVGRNSPLAACVANVCADACDNCIRECQQHHPSLQYLEHCAYTCEMCLAACRRLAETWLPLEVYVHPRGQLSGNAQQRPRAATVPTA